MSEIVSETLREITPAEMGTYTVVSLLKEGPRSRVFLAEKAGKRFVLKAPSSDGGKDLELLRREWELSIGLSHPGLCYVFAWEESSPVGPCLVQEWVDGHPLSEFLREQPSTSRRKRVFAQLLSVLAYLHRKGVIHNDLSPANILITRADDAVKIIDLGYADDDMHFAGKAMGGTPAYASPELLAGKQTDARSDIWAVGALMREIFPHRYGRIVRRCLRPDPARRYAGVDALEKAWRNYWTPLWAGLIATVLVGVGVLAFFLSETHSKLNDLRIIGAEREAVLSAVSTELDSLKRIEAEREAALSDAKGKVDAWYAKEVPAVKKALKRATSVEEVDAAWSSFVERVQYLNTDIPAQTPESVRAQLRDYIFQRYCDDLIPLQGEWQSRREAVTRN